MTTKLRKLSLAAVFALGTPLSAFAQPGFPPNDPDSWRVAGTAKILCSALFVSGRDQDEARAHVTPYFLGAMADSITNMEVDRQRKLVRLTVANRITREAKLYGDQGCIVHQPGRDTVFFKPVRVATTLPPASTMPWPMGDNMPNAPLPTEIDTVKLSQALEAAFENPKGYTAAFVVVYKGRIVAERYGAGANQDMQLESWSAGKSIVGTLVGMLVQQGAVKLEDPAPIPEWRKSPDDPRGKIRVIDLMRMSSGIRFSRGSPEDNPGYHDHDLGYTGAIDAFTFATTRPLQFEPNTFGRYRNSDPLALGMIVRDIVRKRGQEYLTWPQQALFDKIGIRRQVLETDPYGNFLLNGFDYGTARNWARIGMLYLNDGMWQGQRLLPQGWTKFVSTPAPAWKDSSYGGMVWVNARGAWPELPRDAFAFRGAGLQDVYVIPSRDMVIVRMGHFIGSQPGNVDLRRANALLMQAIPEVRGQQQAMQPAPQPAAQPAARPPIAAPSTPTTSATGSGTYRLVVCQRSGCSLGKGDRAAVVGTLVLADSTLTFAAQPDSVRNLLAPVGLPGAANGCFALKRQQRTSTTYAGVSAAGSTNWQRDASGNVTFSLYQGQDASNIVTGTMAADSIQGTGKSTGASAVELRYPNDKVMAVRIGPPDPAVCVDASAREWHRLRTVFGRHS